jgi:hypothetical protein
MKNVQVLENLEGPVKVRAIIVFYMETHYQRRVRMLAHELKFEKGQKHK